MVAAVFAIKRTERRDCSSHATVSQALSSFIGYARRVAGARQHGDALLAEVSQWDAYFHQHDRASRPSIPARVSRGCQIRKLLSTRSTDGRQQGIESSP